MWVNTHLVFDELDAERVAGVVVERVHLPVDFLKEFHAHQADNHVIHARRLREDVRHLHGGLRGAQKRLRAQRRGYYPLLVSIRLEVDGGRSQVQEVVGRALWGANVRQRVQARNIHRQVRAGGRHGVGQAQHLTQRSLKVEAEQSCYVALIHTRLPRSFTTLRSTVARNAHVKRAEKRKPLAD